MSSKELITGYLEKYGWNFQWTGSETILSGWQGSYGDLPLQIKSNKTSIRFCVEPLIQLDFPNRPYAEILRYILSLNESLHFIKINIDNRGHVNLYMDLFSGSLNYDNFCKSIEIIGYYSDLLIEKITEKHSIYKKPSIRKHLN